MYLGGLVKDELSGSIAKTYVSKISGFHRIQASTMYHDAALFVVDEMKRLELSDVEILQFPADGKRKYWLYRSSPGWTVRSAELRLLEPKDELLADFEDIPTSLHTFSQATPGEGVTAELIDVGAGTSATDYKGKKVKGKIVLARGTAHAVHIEAVVKRGAAGVVTDSLQYEFPRVRETLDVPDAHAYQGIWPTSDFAKKVTFGFSVTKRQGEELRGFLARGDKVKLKAHVDAKLFPGKYDVVTATIRGSSKPNEEIFLTAHLCHPKPGANDNASGSGMLMEIARTITALIDAGKIKRPARTIRFYWVPETLGTVALLSTRKDLRDRLVAGVNLDMVGEDQVKCDSTLHLSMTPDSLPSYLNDLVSQMLSNSTKELDHFAKIGLASKFRYVSTPFSPGSDHSEFVEAGVGIPCVSLTQWPDRFYHTSQDTIDKVSEDSLKRVGWAVAMTVLTLANADAGTGHELAVLTYSRGEARIADAARKASEEFFRASKDHKVKDKGPELARLWKYHENRLSHIVEREQKAVRSVLAIGRDDELESLVETLSGHLAEAGDKASYIIGRTAKSIAKASRLKLSSSVRESKAERVTKTLVPKRLFRGTVPWSDLQELLSDKQRSAYEKIEDQDLDFGSKIAETVNLMDGKRSVDEIVAALCAEYGPTEHGTVLTFLRDMEHLGFVSFK